MTTYQSSIILGEISHLIAYTCRNQVSDPKHADGFHRALIKKYFNADKVVISPETKEIFMSLPNGNGQYVPINFEYTNFEEFLCACIEDDLRSLAFYQNILGYYTIVAEAS